MDVLHRLGSHHPEVRRQNPQLENGPGVLQKIPLRRGQQGRRNNLAIAIKNSTSLLSFFLSSPRDQGGDPYLLGVHLSQQRLGADKHLGVGLLQMVLGLLPQSPTRPLPHPIAACHLAQGGAGLSKMHQVRHTQEAHDANQDRLWQTSQTNIGISCLFRHFTCSLPQALFSKNDTPLRQLNNKDVPLELGRQERVSS